MNDDRLNEAKHMHCHNVSILFWSKTNCTSTDYVVVCTCIANSYYYSSSIRKLTELAYFRFGCHVSFGVVKFICIDEMFGIHGKINI